MFFCFCQNTPCGKLKNFKTNKAVLAIVTGLKNILCWNLLGSFNGPEPGGLLLTIRKKQRERDTGTEALVEQRCFNDLSVSIYRLLHKKFLLIMIMIRKPNTATVTKGTRD